MLNEFLITKIEEEDISSIWFQQDGATCHVAEATLDVLRPVFEDRIISRRVDVVWPLRICDLTPLGYYLWGAVKDKCYAAKPETIDALKDNIREAIGEIQLHTSDKRRILSTFDFNRKALRATQPKLHLIFGALFLKIALSAAELMTFYHRGAAI